jgi:hypothetical protein
VALQAALADQAIVAVDPSGTIRHCSTGAAKLLEHLPGALQGRPLTDVLPSLALRPRTPGYNLAYLLMNYGCGGWHSCVAPLAQAADAELELSVVVMHLGKRPWILLGLRRAGDEDAAEPRGFAARAHLRSVS